MASCGFPGGCTKPAHNGPWCDMHYKRAQRLRAKPSALPLAAEPGEQLPPHERFIARALELANCSADDDAEYEAAENSLRVATERWMRSRGWVPIEEAEKVLRERLGPLPKVVQPPCKSRR